MNRFLPVIAIGVLGAACNGSSTGPGPGVSVSFSVQPPGAQAPAVTDLLVVTKAEIVLRKLKLEPKEVASCEEDLDDSPTASEGEGENENADGCEEFRAGPFLLNIPLDKVETTVTVSPPLGTYKEAQFQIHKATGNNASDAAFLTANPTFGEKSIRVEGTFNGVPFVFESDFTVVQELDLNPPLVVTDQTVTNITIQVDMSMWFLKQGGGVIDPASANKGGPNESLVKNNIRRSFRAFEDKDRDGHEDH